MAQRTGTSILPLGFEGLMSDFWPGLTDSRELTEGFQRGATDREHPLPAIEDKTGRPVAAHG